MTRWLLSLLAATLLLSAPASGEEEAKNTAPELASVKGLGADAVRAGCGKRLYYGEYRFVHVGGTGHFPGSNSTPTIHVGGKSILVQEPGAGAWSRVKAPPELLFPEIFGAESLAANYEVVEPPKEIKGAPGLLLVPRHEIARKLVETVRLVTDFRGRPVEIEIAFSGGGREFRTYSGWSSATGLSGVEDESPDTVQWPPESEWGSPVETTFDALGEKVRGLKSMTGRYVREKTTQLLLKPFVAKGEFRFVPGRLLWMDEEPRPSQVLITRKKMEVYDPKNKRLERFLFGDSRMGDYVFVGFGDSASVAFRSFRPLAFSRTDEEVKLRCRPVAGALLGHIDTLTLRIDAKTGLMKELSYVDPSGDSVSTRVSHVRTDRDLDEDDVALKPAKGTRIIENSGEMPWR